MMSAEVNTPVTERRTAFKVPTDQQVIAPGEIQQLMVKSDMSGTLLAVGVGPQARAVKLWVGRNAVDCPEDLTNWRPELPVEAGKFIILTVQNTGEEPAVFSALFFVDAPNHKIVIGEPQAPPPMPLHPNGGSIEPTQQPSPRVAAHMGLTQALPPGPSTTPADHNIRPTMNEVAIVMQRNEAQFLLANLRNKDPLPESVRFPLIRRLDDVLKAKR